jgi:hypothetical protein
MILPTWALLLQIASLFFGFRPAPLAERALMAYLGPIEFRPNDLASPRAVRRTDDLPPNLEKLPAARLEQSVCTRT